MTAVDPQTKIRRIVAEAKAVAQTRAPLAGVWLDRPFFVAVCRAYAIDPRNATGGLTLDGVPIRAHEVYPPVPIGLGRKGDADMTEFDTRARPGPNKV